VSSPLLTPELVGHLGRLDLVARLVVEGFLTGLHKSPYHGFSAEFSEYRHRPALSEGLHRGNQSAGHPAGGLFGQHGFHGG